MTWAKRDVDQNDRQKLKAIRLGRGLSPGHVLDLSQVAAILWVGKKVLVIVRVIRRRWCEDRLRGLLSI